MATKNLKVLMSGDTKPYREEIDKAGAATAKFQQSAGDSFNELAQVFGVNIGQIKGQLTAFEGGFKTLLTSMKASAAGASFFSGAMNIVKIALASTGIGLLVVALGSMVAYFTQTREGANQVKVALASIGAVIRVLVDRFSSFGEGIVKLFSLDFKGSAAAFKASVAGIGQELKDESAAAADLARKKQALNKEERENIVLQSQRKDRASYLRMEAKQEEYTAQEKKKMLLEAKQLIIDYYNEEKHIAEGRRDIAAQESVMHNNMGDELTNLEEAKAKVYEIDTAQNVELKAMSREYNKVNKEIASQTAEIIKNNEAKRKADAKGFTTGMKSRDPKLVAPEDVIKKVTPEEKKKTDDDNKMFEVNLKKSQALSDARWRKERENMGKTKDVYIDLSESINSGLTDMGTGLGEFFGSMLNGEGSLQSFGSMIASVFADAAIQVGKIVIGMALAMDATKKALHFGNPWVAFAAGVALLAIGTATKGALANVASGGASGSMPSGGQNYNFDSRGTTNTATAQKVNVVVTGVLTAGPKGLSTVLNNENTRLSVVT